MTQDFYPENEERELKEEELEELQELLQKAVNPRKRRARKPRVNPQNLNNEPENGYKDSVEDLHPEDTTTQKENIMSAAAAQPAQPAAAQPAQPAPTTGAATPAVPVDGWFVRTVKEHPRKAMALAAISGGLIVIGAKELSDRYGAKPAIVPDQLLLG